MPAIPVICNNPKCGLVFPSDFSIENSSNITFRNSFSGKCPQCGSPGRISDGTYSALGDEFSALLFNQSDRAILDQLKTVVEKAIKEKNFENTKSELAKISPNWRNVFNLLPKENTGNAIAVYSFVLAMINTAVTMYALSKPIEKDVFIDQSYNLFYSEAPRVLPPKEGPFRKKALSEAIGRYRF